jgi:Flp pilus assembly pilin Flp
LVNPAPSRSLRRAAARLLSDDGAGEVIEYALILGLIGVVALAVIAAFGTKVLARWTSVNGSM